MNLQTETYKSFENDKFNLSEVETILTNDNPDSNFFNEKINSVESAYYTHEKFVSFSSNLSENFSIIHLNIKSLHKNIDKLKDFLKHIKGKFSVIVLSETRIDDDKAELNSLFLIPNYSFIHEKRKNNHKGGGLGIYVHKILDYKNLPNLAKNTENTETFTTEIENKNPKNILISVVHRPPRGNQSKFLEETEQVVHNSKHSTKLFFLAGDLNLNSLDYASSTPVKIFFNLAFEKGIFPVINRPTRVTWASATAIDHILTNTIMDQDLQNGIIKLDIIDHFPIFAILNSKVNNQCPKTKIPTRTIKEVSVENFKNILSSTDWNDVLGKTITNESYNQFIKRFSLIYDDCFPIKVIEIKTKNLRSPWITKGIKSHPRENRNCKTNLRKRSPQNEKEYKDYKQLFEKIKKDSKKKYFQEKLSFYKNDFRNAWENSERCNWKNENK